MGSRVRVRARGSRVGPNPNPSPSPDLVHQVLDLLVAIHRDLLQTLHVDAQLRVLLLRVGVGVDIGFGRSV